MITQAEAESRVAKGATYLDRVRPGWFDRIDVGTLTLHDPCGCIIGQVCRATSFRDGFEALGLDAESVRACGMNLVSSDCNYDIPFLEAVGRREYKLLQDAWIQEIATRRHPVSEIVAPLAEAACN